MANERGLTIGFPRMYNEPGERRAFLPPLVGLLASMDVDVFVEAGGGRRHGLPGRGVHEPLAAGPRRRRGDGLRARTSSWCCGRPRAATSWSGGAPSCSRCSTSPRARSGSSCWRASGIEAIALDMVTGDDGRRLVQNLREVARNGLVLRVRRARAPLAAAALAVAARGERHRPGRRRRRQARHRVGRQGRRRGAQRAVHGAPGCPASRSWSSSRTSPATRPTSGTGSR